jgi:hypothetical protein
MRCARCDREIDPLDVVHTQSASWHSACAPAPAPREQAQPVRLVALDIPFLDLVVLSLKLLFIQAVVGGLLALVYFVAR